MKADAAFVVQKEIGLVNGGSIAVGTTIYRTHGNYYMDGGLLPMSYQEDFRTLVDNEEKNGWKYLRPEKFSNLVNDI